MVTPASMPRKLPDGLVKLKREDVEVARVPYDLFAKVDKRIERRERREERDKNVHVALSGNPLVDDVQREVKWQKRNAKKNQAIARINRKRRPKKR